MSAGSGAFWAWSLERYEKAGVAPALLALQDERGLDVNIVLWIAWRAAHGAETSRELLDEARRAVAAWSQAATIPLRGVRRTLKRPPDGARADLAELTRALTKKAELAAERVAQDMLESLAPFEPAKGAAPNAPALFMRALLDYAALAGSSPPPEARIDDLGRRLFSGLTGASAVDERHEG